MLNILSKLFEAFLSFSVSTVLLPVFTADSHNGPDSNNTQPRHPSSESPDLYLSNQWECKRLFTTQELHQ